jgi:hypothetical protein
MIAIEFELGNTYDIYFYILYSCHEEKEQKKTLGGRKGKKENIHNNIDINTHTVIHNIENIE